MPPPPPQGFGDVRPAGGPATPPTVASVKKIRKFKLQPRLASVLKNLRALLENAQATPELEKAVEDEARAAQRRIDTGALYATYGPGQAPGWTEDLWRPVAELRTPGSRSEPATPGAPEALMRAAEPLIRAADGEGDPVALTVFAATVGTGLEEEIAAALARGEGLRSRILTALGEELAEQAGQFVFRLLAEEAKTEACELSDRRPFADADRQRALLESLDAARVPLSFDASGHLSPRFSRLGYVLWRPPAKKRK